jgi:DNA repair exonuclease SbcCD nuclease subunit
VKIAHLADIHLGFRQYHRLNPQGINQREADVAAAFRNAIDGVIAARPDIVVIAGDLFHSVRPTNPAILHSFNQFRKLRLALPETPLIIVAGNHDTPRSIETGTILQLFEAFEQAYVVFGEPKTLVFDTLDLEVTCVPHASWKGERRPSLLPKGRFRFHVAVTHGEVAGVRPKESWAAEYGGVVLEPSELHADRWDYIALGHFHVAHQVRENAWYAGALEYVTPNPWGELRDEAIEGRASAKGWLLVELSEGAPQVKFMPVQLARGFFDLAPIQGASLSSEELNAAIMARIEALRGGVDDRVVRQVVYDVPRLVSRDVDHAAVRNLKASALHYHLDMRRPPPTGPVGIAPEGKRQTLREVLVDFLERRPLDITTNRGELVAMAKTYMDRVDRLDDEA